MCNLYMMVGLPGSGKTSYAKTIENAVVLSSDEIRESLFGDCNDQKHNNELFSYIHKQLIKNLKDNKDVVMDATNISKKRRIHLLKQIPKDVKKHCIVMATPYEDCLKRNFERERKVPESVIRRMRLSWCPPHTSEGFDSIKYVFPDGIQKREPYEWVESVKDFDQENPHHCLTLGGHCRATAAYVGRVSTNNILKTAALLHDLGKEYTKVFFDKKGNPTKDAHYYNHHNVGSYEAMFFLPEDEIEEVTNLIYYHMAPFNWVKSKKAYGRDTSLLGREFIANIELLHDADVLAH